ncbi:tyrosine-type recombinase/integrase [Streptomyces sp. B1866]|uniref:tyrosine-type recombinase/integrase n=1 Tax=Streptomyces sp. B1866 TaxID=3075431 RepID=UPI00289189F5|nr:tyrosine-type recombinase/integrase [Streptomyces sp. B1866]MDT3397321.1 tyrosine-type recombinase/integrase [Streptomyces sp. B1866]
MTRAAELPGAASLVLASGVVHIDPAPAVFEAMLDGWAMQQRTRFLKAATIRSRIDLVRRFAVFTNEYPWQWRPVEVEAFIDHLRSGQRPIVVSTARGYQNTLRLFMEYVTDVRYAWPRECEEKFGQAPVQILHEWNTVAHVAEYEGDPRRRPLTYDEVQALFDAADARVEEIRARRRKGALAAMRDAVLLKTVYAYGLRRREAWGLDLPDFRHNPKARGYGRCGALYVRWGKSSKGSPPKRRTVLTVPEMDWIVPALEQWLDEIRPAFGPGRLPALWVTERQSRLSRRSVNEAFEEARDAAGLPEELDLHCLRHSYVTHLIEFDYPERFVQDQVGHEYASTTALYTGVSDEYRNRLLQRSLDRHADRWSVS